jgi:hypothetical protein
MVWNAECPTMVSRAGCVAGRVPLCGLVDQGGDLVCAAPGQADACSAVAVVVDEPCRAGARLLFEADFVASGAKAHAVPGDLGRTEPGVEGSAAGEDGRSGLRGGFPVPASGFGGAAEHEMVFVGVDGDQVG